MLIKYTDDKRPTLATLQDLLGRPDADAATKKRIEQEIRNIQAGARGEEEAAYEIKVHYGDNPNWMVIHDLRIEHGGLVAQIDHLLINRWLEMWVCESKHFSEGIAINEHGEFTAFYGNKPYGVPSPIEQNNRHIVILKRLFESAVVKLPTRLGFVIKPELRSLILVSKGARISRPKEKLDGIEAVIKSDHLFKTIDKSIDDTSPLSLAKLVGRDTLEALAKDIANLHKPITFNWHAKFGLPEQIQPVKSAPIVVSTPIEQPFAQTQADVDRPSVPKSDPGSDGKKPKQKLVCHTCSEPIAYNVAKFCWFNKPRFGGNLYCVACQKLVPVPTGV